MTSLSPFLGGAHDKILVFEVEQKKVTRFHEHWSPWLIFAAFCNVVRARLVWWGLGSKFGRKTRDNLEHMNYSVSVWASRSHAMLRRQALAAAKAQLVCPTYRPAQRNTPADGGP